MRNVGDLARIHFDPDENQTCETCFIVWDKSQSKVTEKLRTINMLTFEYFKFCFKSLNKIKINLNEEMKQNKCKKERKISILREKINFML